MQSENYLPKCRREKLLFLPDFVTVFHSTELDGATNVLDDGGSSISCDRTSNFKKTQKQKTDVNILKIYNID